VKFRDVSRKGLLSDWCKSGSIGGAHGRQMNEFYLVTVLIALLLTAVVVALMNMSGDGLQR